MFSSSGYVRCMHHCKCAILELVKGSKTLEPPQPQKSGLTEFTSLRSGGLLFSDVLHYPVPKWTLEEEGTKRGVEVRVGMPVPRRQFCQELLSKHPSLFTGKSKARTNVGE